MPTNKQSLQIKFKILVVNEGCNFLFVTLKNTFKIKELQNNAANIFLKTTKQIKFKQHSKNIKQHFQVGKKKSSPFFKRFFAKWIFRNHYDTKFILQKKQPADKKMSIVYVFAC
jgi:hypothetical protein